jgi:hypothetical protein
LPYATVETIAAGNPTTAHNNTDGGEGNNHSIGGGGTATEGRLAFLLHRRLQNLQDRRVLQKSSTLQNIQVKFIADFIAHFNY